MSYRMKPAAIVCAIALVATAACAPSDSVAPSAVEPTAAEPSTAASEAGSQVEVGVTFSGTIPDGWTEGDDGYPVPDAEGASFEINQNEVVMAANCDYEPEDGVGTTAADIVGAIASREGLESSGQQGVTVGGLPGQQLDFHAADDGAGATCPADDNAAFVPLWGHFDGGDWLFTGALPTEDHRVVFLDVPGGGTVGVWVYTTEPEVLADYLPAATEVMNGLEFDTP